MKRHVGRVAMLAALLLLLSALAGCGGGQGGSGGNASSGGNPSAGGSAPATPAPVKVRLAQSSTTFEPNHAFMTLAKHLGYYTEEGLDVELLGINGSNESVKLVASGQLDIAYAGAIPMILGRSQGMDLKAVYMQDIGNIYELAIPDESPIKGLADLKGKTIGVSALSSGTVPYLKAMLKEAKLDPEKDVTIVAVGVGAQAATALTTKKVDAVALWDAQHGILETQGLKFRYVQTEAVKGQPSTPFVVRADYLSKNRDVVIRVLRAVSKSALFAQTNPEAAVRIHWAMYPDSKPTGISEGEALKRAVHVMKARMKNWKSPQDKARWGEMKAEQWRLIIDFMVQTGSLKQSLPAEEMFTTELLDEINKFDAQKVIDQAKNFKL